MHFKLPVKWCKFSYVCVCVCVERAIFLFFFLRYSPSTVDGAGHFVISIGTNIMQLALNSHQSMAAFKACIGMCFDCFIVCLFDLLISCFVMNRNF